MRDAVAQGGCIRCGVGAGGAAVIRALRGFEVREGAAEGRYWTGKKNFGCFAGVGDRRLGSVSEFSLRRSERAPLGSVRRPLGRTQQMCISEGS